MYVTILCVLNIEDYNDGGGDGDDDDIVPIIVCMCVAKNGKQCID